ncbi:MAG: FemAB family XrtA/PEP-CTERM system-associated protein [Nitrospiria bacterium]
MNLALVETYAPLEVMSADSADHVEWDRYVLRHPDATVCHLSAWGRTIERTFDYRSLSCLARRGDQVTGVLPLYLVRTLPFGRALISTPLAVYGGICADDAETAQALAAHAKALADRLGVRYLELRHRTPIGGLPTKDLYVTFRREISADPEKNLAAIPRKQRRMIRQGEQAGLTARIGGGEWLNEFYHVYAQSVRNLGTPVYPQSLFRHLLDELGPACRIMVVFREGRVIAGVLTLFFRDQVLPYYGGALRGAFQYAANDFMYWRLLSYAGEQGYKVFDFGRSKVDSGPYHFKRHWGFEPTPLPYEYYLAGQRAIPDLSPRNPKFSAAIACWKRLPFGMTTWLGPKLIRFFP